MPVRFAALTAPLSNLWGVFKQWWRQHGPLFSFSGEARYISFGISAHNHNGARILLVPMLLSPATYMSRWRTMPAVLLMCSSRRRVSASYLTYRTNFQRRS